MLIKKIVSAMIIFGMSSVHASIDDIATKYQDEFSAKSAALNEQQQDKGFECLISLDMDADWELTKVSFDVPEVHFRTKDMKFHFLKTYSQMIDFSFDIPVFEWGRTNIGPVKLDLPKTYSKRVEVKTKIPKFEWGKTSIKTKIPVFNSKRIEWKFHILKIKKIKEFSIPCPEESQRVRQAQSDENSIRDAAVKYEKEAKQNVVTDLVHASDEINNHIAKSESSFKQAISEVDSAMIELISMGADITKVKTEFDGQKVQLTELRNKLVERQTSTTKKLVDEQKKIADLIEKITS